jgi:hypothetical protein
MAWDDGSRLNTTSPFQFRVVERTKQRDDLEKAFSLRAELSPGQRVYWRNRRKLRYLAFAGAGDVSQLASGNPAHRPAALPGRWSTWLIFAHRASSAASLSVAKYLIFLAVECRRPPANMAT